MLAAIAAHSGVVEGIILASFGDTGAAEVRASRPGLPVIGIAEAAFAEARRIGGRFSIVTFAPEVAPSLIQRAHDHGVADALHRVACLPDPLEIPAGDIADRLSDQLHDLCDLCAAEGVDSLVLGGGPLAGLAPRIAARCSVPVIDGTQAAIEQLRARLDRGTLAPANG